ncbi:hypothetical protein [Psychroserpens damuponensis]|uniref:hypothetical protein n=1 Tax=Psychroserpens damuponensis TaxID=943936 RepID=UPI00058BC431|nr:hypothetical protein [Psychroserpens damuponensis]
MDIDHFILFLAGAISSIVTFVLQIHYKLGAVRASALIGVFVGVFVLLFPKLCSPYLTENLPLVCFGASFIGMVSSDVLSNYFLIGISGILFTIIFLNTSVYFEGFGGGLGSAACIGLLVTLSVPILKKNGTFSNGFAQLRRQIQIKKRKKRKRKEKNKF